MAIKTRIKRILYAVLGAMGFLILLLVSGVWPILLLMLFGSFGGVLWLLFHAAKPARTVEPMQPSQSTSPEPTESDLQALAWSVLLRRVTLLVAADYPNARWIWESPDAGRRFQEGSSVFILLNRAGGHRRARVVIQNLQAVGLEYDPAPEQAAASEAETAKTEEPQAENYELLAFEWVDAHSIDLDARCKEAAEQKLLELVLLAQELPVRESWPDICKELARAGLKNAKCCPEGIRIDLTQWEQCPAPKALSAQRLSLCGITQHKNKSRKLQKGNQTMSVYVNNLFNFSRSLPAPFDGLTTKKVSVSSKYGDGTTATLCTTVIKAVHAVCKCMSGTEEGAVGTIDHRTVAEYKSSMGADTYHLAVYDSHTGAVMASLHDKSTETFANYTLNSSGKDGAAVIMAMFPKLLEDEEFAETFGEYRDQFDAGYPDMERTVKLMGILCDNAYRRVKDDTCPAALKVNLDKAGNLMRVSQVQLDSGKFTPTKVLAGEFTIFAKTERVTVSKAPTLVEHSDFVGKYVLHPRALSESEQALVPQLPEWYIVPQEVVDICRHAQATTGKPMQMRNFLLRGPAGTGKTMSAKAIAAGLHLPYMAYTCSAGTEIFDFIGQIFPESESGSTGDAQLDQERKQLKEMGGITYANVAKLMKLPDLEDMDYDPAGVWQALTGMGKEDATAQDCMALVLDRVTEKVRALSKRDANANSGGQTYTYTETDFIKALKFGYVIEIQEPTTIVQPGVLVGLNSLLEQTGAITLPTGEVIERHPDAVVVVTTNISYEGCRGMNQSVLDRMSLVRDVELPTPEVMVQRAMSVTGATDEYQVSQMVQVVNDLAEYCRKNSITDGSYGMRSLIDWIVSSEITGDVYQSALYTIISKATADETDREALISAVLEPVFAPKRRAIA